MPATRYEVRITESADGALQGLDRPIRARVTDVLESLADAPMQGKALKGPLSGKRSTRVRKDYRVIWEVDHANETVTVVAVAHRSDVYRR